jgi:hypothetical protein
MNLEMKFSDKHRLNVFKLERIKSYTCKEIKFEFEFY